MKGDCMSDEEAARMLQSETDEAIFEQRRGNEHRVGDWMETAGGRQFFPLDPRPEEVDLDDVAHHLARINRYNGCFQLDRYSVGEHAVLMCEWVMLVRPDEPFLAYQALHHDDAEAYISDMIRPLKRNMPQFVEIEENLWNRALAPAFDLGWEYEGQFTFDLHPFIKELDNRILVDERRQVVGVSKNPWGIDHLEPLGVTCSGLSPRYVKATYLKLHRELRERLGLA